jgi:plasmid stability protein
MATVTIRNLDDDVVELARRRAKANNRSLEAELRTIITSAVRPLSPEELFRIADEIRASTRGRPQTDSGILQREGRDELDRRADRR